MTEATADRPVVYLERSGTWTTPGGRGVVMTYRDDTSDWNTVQSIMAADEYDFHSITDLRGVVLDIGAHIGAASIAIALDHPEAHVIAVEAIEENADLLRRNAAANGAKVDVIVGAAAGPKDKRADVFWRATENESARHHAFIGNSTLVYAHGDVGHQTASVACWSLSRILDGRQASLVKIDCEGCEWSFLTDPAINAVPLILGEWHPVNGHVRDEIDALLPTHEVAFTGPREGPGGFKAVWSA